MFCGFGDLVHSHSVELGGSPEPWALVPMGWTVEALLEVGRVTGALLTFVCGAPHHLSYPRVAVDTHVVFLTPEP